MANFTRPAGTRISFIMRIAQLSFSCSSFTLMYREDEFYGYSAFSYLIYVMCLLMSWSLLLALVDGFSVRVGSPRRQPVIQIVIFIADWVFSLLSLSAACGAAAVVSFLPEFRGSDGRRYLLSAIMAFFAWVPMIRINLCTLDD
ncbi:hypothetical protein MKW94_025868 [Papaver nudicaule]|uniref:CASP-like protein n=1 Tax=Papaver nudicaule TaxID=74823 RepID=A0AA42B496_PAPNU|nr:hypothetical protein [Papaver nudicaule]